MWCDRSVNCHCAEPSKRAAPLKPLAVHVFTATHIAALEEGHDQVRCVHAPQLPLAEAEEAEIPPDREAPVPQRKSPTPPNLSNTIPHGCGGIRRLPGRTPSNPPASLPQSRIVSRPRIPAPRADCVRRRTRMRREEEEEQEAQDEMASVVTPNVCVFGTDSCYSAPLRHIRLRTAARRYCTAGSHP